MGHWRYGNSVVLGLVLWCGMLWGLSGCGSNTPGRMEWVQPLTDKPRAGTVYCIRGWAGVFSSGIDEMARQLNEQGVTALVYQPEQYPELAATMVKRYRGMKPHEPICFIGHSRGCDSSLIISRELAKIGVKVDLIVTLDSVDETVVPRNVALCYNYWMPGIFFNTNLLRGIPLTQEAGSTGQLHNINLHQEGQNLREPLTNHVDIDKGPKLQRRIIQHVLDVCPERAKWRAQVAGKAP